MPYAKGSVVQATLDFLTRETGAETFTRILELLPPATRTQVEEATAMEEVHLATVFALWRAADEVLAPTDPGWMERAGAHSIDSLGMQLYGRIVRKPTPHEFLAQRISLFRLFYRSGEMEVVERGEDFAVLRLVDLPLVDPLFCRRQTGGLRRVLELAGGASPTVEHVRCCIERDAFCEWELRWS